MIELIIAYLTLIVIILLFIIVFLTLYIIHEHRRKNITQLNQDQYIVPLLTLKTNEQSNGNNSNSAILSATPKRTRHRPPTLFIRTQNSQGFLLSNGDLSSVSIHNKKLTQHHTKSTLDLTTIHFDS
ncbi:unnamed protein product [Rotaria magnacalcarata]|uniref:Uncharacterized protein n=1 Tax=Rotaria magnacalcarata TaxID=392030 RepID=A0A816YZI3_9BILA|nr:unnamed protein product [Rotaria magnacalcarata]CAF1360419.1 unnamed protein product [Rotaria magnacalcarata]CAF2177658.1 unnamed protein product [Rotaria magnacalcarata]CAF4016859.1 unnamed protein product [Rotaria magnacalcarata]CAF4131956.1 unnamed protein product [Rotaria magnacalcarata]